MKHNCRYYEGRMVCDDRKWVKSYIKKLSIPFGGSYPGRKRTGKVSEKVYMNDELLDSDYIDDRARGSYRQWKNKMQKHVDENLFEYIEQPEHFNYMLNTISDERIIGILADMQDINWGEKVGRCRKNCTWLTDESLVRMAKNINNKPQKLRDVFIIEMAQRIRQKRR